MTQTVLVTLNLLALKFFMFYSFSCKYTKKNCAMLLASVVFWSQTLGHRIFVHKFGVQTNFGSQAIFGHKHCLGHNKIWVTFLGGGDFGPQKIWSRQMVVHKNIGVWKLVFLVQYKRFFRLKLRNIEHRYIETSEHRDVGA